MELVEEKLREERERLPDSTERKGLLRGGESEKEMADRERECLTRKTVTPLVSDSTLLVTVGLPLLSVTPRIERDFS